MQQALFVTEAGKPLTLGTRPIPKPEKGQIQIKVDSTMLLPHDTYGRDLGLFIGSHLPAILGTNISRTITSVHPTVTHFAIWPDYNKYSLLNAEAAAKIPDRFTPDEAATFPVNATTSFAALFDGKGFGFPAPFPDVAEKKDFKAAEISILVVGGGSNVGKLAIQYAKLAGIGRIIAIASPGRTEELKALGATHVIDRHASLEDIQRQIKEVTGQDGLEKIYDCPSTLLTLHPAEEAQEQAKEKRPNARVQFILGTSDFIQPDTKQFWEALAVWIKRRELAVGNYRVIEGLDLKTIDEGLDSYRDRSAVTPVIVHPNPQ